MKTFLDIVACLILSIIPIGALIGLASILYTQPIMGFVFGGGLLFFWALGRVVGGP
jgi:hypothetical protein